MKISKVMSLFIMLLLTCIVSLAQAVEAKEKPDVQVEKKAEEIAGSFIKAIGKCNYSFLTEDEISGLQREIHDFARQYLHGRVSDAEFKILISAVEKYRLRYVKHSDPASQLYASEMGYFEFHDQVSTFKWLLWQALRREAQSHGDVKRRNAQHQWLREFIKTVAIRPGDYGPEGVNHDQKYKWAEDALEQKFANPLSLMSEAMTDEQFVNFKEWMKRSSTNGLSHTISDIRCRVIGARAHKHSGVESVYKYPFDIKLPFEDEVKSMWGGGNSHLAFASNAQFRGKEVFIDARGHSIFDVAGLSTMSVESKIDDEKQEEHFNQWAEQQNKGDLAYLPADARVITLRGAKLAELKVANWFEADRLNNDELRESVNNNGRTKISVEKLPPMNGPLRLDARVFIAVETAEKRLAVIALKNRESGHLYLRCRARDADSTSHTPAVQVEGEEKEIAKQGGESVQKNEELVNLPKDLIWTGIPKGWDRERLWRELADYLKEQVENDLSDSNVTTSDLSTRNGTAIKNGQLHISYRTKEYIVERPAGKSKTAGMVSRRETGPQPDGLIMRVWLSDEVGQFERPQVSDRTYWELYLTQIYMPEMKIYLYANISYGSKTDKRLLQKYRNLAGWLENVVAGKLPEAKPGVEVAGADRKVEQENSGAGKLLEEAKTVMTKFQQALNASEWNKALSLCSDVVQSEAKKYESAGIFFQEVVPVEQIISVSNVQTFGGQFGPDNKRLAYFCFLRLSEPDARPIINWEWRLNKTDSGWVVDFKNILLGSWIEQERLRLNREHEKAKERDRTLQEGLKLSLVPLSDGFVIGQPMLFRLEMTNISGSPIVYEKIFFSMINNPMAVTGPGGKRLEYLSSSVQTTWGPPDNIEPNQTLVLAEKYDVTIQYHITQPGQYTFQFTGHWVLKSNIVRMNVKQGELSSEALLVEKLKHVLPKGWTLTRTRIRDIADFDSETDGGIVVNMVGKRGRKGTPGGTVGVFVLINPSQSFLEKTEHEGELWGQSQWGPVYVKSLNAEQLWPNYKEQIIQALGTKNRK